MKKFKLDKEMSKRLAALSMAGMILVGGISLSGCSKKNNSESNVTISASDEVLNQVNSITDLLNKNIEGKFYLNSDDVLSAITLLNIDYVINNGEASLQSLYPNGLNTKKELNDLETFLSKYREYTRTLKSTENFISISDYALIEKDKTIITELENMTKQVITLVNNNESKEEINNIYNKVYAFFVEGGSLNISGKEYTKEDLSNGYRFASENFASIINVLSKNYIDEAKRTKLDNKLKTTDSVYQVQVLLQVFANTKDNVKNTLIDNEDTYILDESDIAVINSFNTKYDEVLNNTKGKFNSTNEEVSAIVQIANIDYLASDNVSAGAMKSIMTKELEEVFKNALSFINKAEEYNKSNTNNLYIYSDLFMNDEENIVNLTAIKGAIKSTLNLNKETNSESDYSTIYNNNNFQFIKLYNQYSSEVGINEKGTKITKNDTGYGTRFITDAIYNKSLNELPIKFNAVIELVDNDDDKLSVLPVINTMTEDKCSKYQYVK